MSAIPIPVELRLFIARHIRTVEQIEILCAVTDDPDKTWQVADIFRKVQSSERSVADCLKKFAGESILIPQTGGAFQLSPDKNLRDMLSQLVKIYRERRVTVTDLIYKAPAGRIEDFAEAFRLKRKD